MQGELTERTGRCDAPAEQLQESPFLCTFTILQNLEMTMHQHESVSGVMAAHLDMRESLAIEYKTLTALHGIIYVEILHAQDVLVDVEGVQVPVVRVINDSPQASRSH